MKTTGNMDGGNLLPQFWDAYTNYEMKFLLEYKRLGISVDYLTIQNEALAWQTFPSMVMLSTDQRDIIKKNFGPRFAANNITTKILVLDHNWDLLDYVLTIMADPVAKSYIAGVAWHCYGGKPNLQSVVHNAHPDMDAFFTECGPSLKGLFGPSLVNTLDELYVQSVSNWARGVLHWNIVLDPNGEPHVPGGCSKCGGLYTVFSNGTYVKEAEYYSLAHNSKFVDVGAYRIDSMSSSTNLISVISYQNPDGSFVAVVVNKSTNSQQFDLLWGSQFVAYSLPAQSVVTFKWSTNNNYIV